MNDSLKKREPKEIEFELADGTKAIMTIRPIEDAPKDEQVLRFPKRTIVRDLLNMTVDDFIRAGYKHDKYCVLGGSDE